MLLHQYLILLLLVAILHRAARYSSNHLSRIIESYLDHPERPHPASPVYASDHRQIDHYLNLAHQMTHRSCISFRILISVATVASIPLAVPQLAAPFLREVVSYLGVLAMLLSIILSAHTFRRSVHYHHLWASNLYHHLPNNPSR